MSAGRQTPRACSAAPAAGAGAASAVAAIGDGGPIEPPPPPPPPPRRLTLTVAGGGNNVAERFTSDLWVHGDYAYTGTWGSFPAAATIGNALKIWSVDGRRAGAGGLHRRARNIATVSDVEVSSDGTVLMFSAEA